MKRLKLIKRLISHGWYFSRQGGRHEIWTNGEHIVAIPRHKEVIEKTARMILRKVMMNQGTKK